MEAELTVYLELDLDVIFHEDKGEDDFGHKYCQPCDYELSCRKGKIPKWLNKEIMKTSGDIIAEECQDTLDTTNRDRKEEKLNYRYEQQKERKWASG